MTDILPDDEFVAQLEAIMSNPVEEFKPFVYYNKDGDLIEVYWTNDDYYAEWINHNLSIYRHMETNEIIGVEINWIKNLMKKAEKSEI